MTPDTPTRASSAHAQEAPVWNEKAEAIRWLNEVELVQGGANGPTIKLRAAIMALAAPTVEPATGGAGAPEVVQMPRQLLVDLVTVWERNGDGRRGSPNHGHEVPGVWDSDNGALAGKPCAECALYDHARKVLAEGAAEWVCCGNPVVGAEYMGQQEMVCCGNMEPAPVGGASLAGQPAEGGFDLREQLAALATRDVQMAPGFFASFVSQNQMLELADRLQVRIDALASPAAPALAQAVERFLDEDDYHSCLALSWALAEYRRAVPAAEMLAVQPVVSATEFPQPHGAALQARANSVAAQSAVAPPFLNAAANEWLRTITDKESAHRAVWRIWNVINGRSAFDRRPEAPVPPAGAGPNPNRPRGL